MPTSTSGPNRSRFRPAFLGIAAVLLAAACGTGAAPTSGPQTGSGAGPPGGPLAQQLTGAVSDDAAMTHMQALQKIADDNGGNRASGTPGYDASVDYVAGVLRGAGFEVSTPTYQVSADEDDDVAAGTGRNVIAQTRTGDPGQVVMIGAHLDSVPEGPGIVDDGSGVASLLEIATRLGTDPAVQNTGSRSSATRRAAARARPATSRVSRPTTARRSRCICTWTWWPRRTAAT